MRITTICISALLICLLFAGVSFANGVAQKKITLSLPKDGTERDSFFVVLLQKALQDINVVVEINYLGNLTYKREIKYLNEGKLSVTWRMNTKERDKKFKRIDVPLTQNLMASRVLLIPSGSQKKFEGIKTLSDLKHSGLVGVFHEDWLDSQVWQSNELPYLSVSGDYSKVFNMLASQNRGIDYFSRSVLEVIQEEQANQKLDIEKNILIIYDADFYFYVGDVNPRIYQTLNEAINRAKESKLIDKLIHQYWGHLYQSLNLEERTIIRLSYTDK